MCRCLCSAARLHSRDIPSGLEGSLPQCGSGARATTPVLSRFPYQGYLLADGFAGYNALYRDPKTNAPKNIVEVGVGAMRAGNSPTSW